MREKCKAAGARVPRDVRVVSVLVLVALAAFGLGYRAGIDAGQGTPLSIDSSPLAASTSGSVVASRSGTKYYLPWCAGAARIADANKVWFPSAALARAQGYSPAANCAGL